MTGATKTRSDRKALKSKAPRLVGGKYKTPVTTYTPTQEDWWAAYFKTAGGSKEAFECLQNIKRTGPSIELGDDDIDD